MRFRLVVSPMVNDDTKLINYPYSGPLAPLCEQFIQEKRALGYQYNTESWYLSQFSKFTESFNCPCGILPQEIVQAWLVQKPMESDKSRYTRYSVVSQFARYMERMGYSAYIPGRDEFGKLHKNFAPYIFSHKEIRSFFAAADAMTLLPHSISPRRHRIMPVLFRLLYCCGLRVSEATKLLGADVDLERGILTIRNSKFGKTRYVPMSPEMTAVCADYAETRLIGPAEADWFFAAPDGGRYGTRVIYGIFRKLLWEAGISHGGRGNGPRLHDFRHTFCVHTLQRWTIQGADPATLLPRLTAYLGHKDFSATEQYLRMTAEAYPEVSRLMEEKYGYIIPSMEGNSDENY